MADGWKTLPIQFNGGLITNLSPLQHGIQAPGSARILRNFEPSTDGGYKKLLGYTKYSSSIVPSYGTPLVHGGSQTGTTLVIANLYLAPAAGDSFTISGVTGTYTIATGGVSYNSSTKRATLTLTTSLASSPADKAAVTFTTNTGLIRGVAAWETYGIAVRNNVVYSSTGTTWTKVNVPSYGTVLVNGGSQTGGSLIVDGLTSIPQAGDTFTIASVALVYTVTAVPTVTSGGATLSISPNLDSSPADNAAITFLTANRTTTNKSRFAKYRIANVEKIVSVDGANFPFIWNGTTYNQLNSAPSDVYGATHVAFHKNQLFFAKGDVLAFTSPYTDTDFNVANGAGVISVGNRITGIVPFREQRIIFSENKISRLTGNTLADFVLQPITESIGCVDEDTIQEVGSDIMFLGPDGLRLLSATDRIGDFNIASVSKQIQKEITDITVNSASFSSVVIKSKSQYRLFGYANNITSSSAAGIIGTQLIGEGGVYYGWADLRGIKSYVSDYLYKSKVETILFANDSGYVYQMEDGNSFDGANIQAIFATPFIPVDDPQLRKTFYKMTLYTDPEGSVNIKFNLKLDLDQINTIQPNSITLINTLTSGGLYDGATTTYGTTVYGGKFTNMFMTQVIGSGFTASLEYTSNDTNPSFSLDAATLEYALFDRR
jgi:hypothetical protein